MKTTGVALLLSDHPLMLLRNGHNNQRTKLIDHINRTFNTFFEHTYTSKLSTESTYLIDNIKNRPHYVGIPELNTIIEVENREQALSYFTPDQEVAMVCLQELYED